MARDPIEQILKQREQSRTQISQWQAEQQQGVEAEAEERRAGITEQISDVEKQSQEQLEAMRLQKAREREKSKLPFALEKEIEPTKEDISALEAERAGIVSSGVRVKSDITKAEQAAVVEIDKVVKEAMASLEADTSRAVGEFKAGNVELSTGEWVDKSSFEKLSDDDQKLLNRLGIKAYERLKKKEFSDNYIETGKEGEYVSKEYYDSLTPALQEYLKTHSLKEYNTQTSYDQYKALMAGAGFGAEAAITLDQWNKLTEDARRSFYDSTLSNYYVSVKNPKTGESEYIDRNTYDNLPSEAMTALLNGGLSGLNQYYDDQFYDNYKEVAAVAGGSAISKTQWNGMTPESRQTEYDNNVYDYYSSIAGKAVIGRDDWNKLDASRREQLISKTISDANFKQINELKDANGEPRIERADWRGLTPEQQALRLDNEVKEFEDKHVQLKKTDEWVSKEYYFDLPFDERTYLEKHGVKDYQSEYYIELKTTGELIRKDAYGTLSGEFQNILQSSGTAGLDKHIEKNYITNTKGELLPKSWYNELTPDQQGFAREHTYEQYIDNYYERLSTDELIDKTAFQAMSVNDQSLLKQLGTVQYSAAKDQEYIAQLKPDAQKFIAEYGLHNFTRILEQANNSTPANALGLYKQIGLIADVQNIDTNSVKRNEKGELEYSVIPASLARAKITDLDKVDYNNLSEQDYYNIARTVSEMPEYRVGLPGQPILPSYYESAMKYARKELTGSDRQALENIANTVWQTKAINTLSIVFPPAQALKPDVTIGQISGADWAIGIANIALLAITPALGAIGKSAGIVGKVASIAGKTVKLAAVATYPAVTASQWKEMTDSERIIGVALNVAIVGAVYGKTILNGLKAVTSKLKTAFSGVPVSIEKLARAVQAKNVPAIKSAAGELESIGRSAGGTNGRILQQQARFFTNYADDIAKGLDAPVSLQEIMRINHGIAKAVRTGEAGGMSYRPDVKQAAGKSAVEVVKAREIIKEEALHPKGTPTEIKLSSTLPDWLRAGIKEGYYQKAPIPEVKPSALPIVPKTTIPTGLTPEEIRQLTKIASEGWFKANLADAVELWLKVKNNIIIEHAIKSLAETWATRIKATDLSKLVGKQMTSGLTAQEITLFTATKQAEIIKQLQGASANAALRQVLSENAVTIAIAADAGAMISIIRQASPDLQSEVLRVLSPDLNAIIMPAISSPDIKSETIQQAQSLATAEFNYASGVIAQIQIANVVKTISEEATQAANKASTAGATQAQISNAVQQAIQAQVKQITDPALREAVLAKTATLVETTVAPETELAMGVAVAVETVEPIDKTKPPRRPYIPQPDGTERPMTDEELAGAIAWKQGFIYIMIFPPYGEENIVYSKKPFPGVNTLTGFRSAYESVIKIGGKIPDKIMRDMGIMDVVITTKNGKPQLKFKQTKKQLTPKMKVV